jgi:hypothetical protein
MHDQLKNCKDKNSSVSYPKAAKHHSEEIHGAGKRECSNPCNYGNHHSLLPRMGCIAVF